MEDTKKIVDESSKYFHSSYQEMIFYQFYARWQDDIGRRETWIEAIDRYMAYMKGKVGEALKESEYAEIREALLNQEICPSMRLLWSAGDACDATNVTAYNCAYVAPTTWKDLSEIMYVSMCGAGCGFAVEQENVSQFPVIKEQTGEKLPNIIVDDSRDGWCEAFLLAATAWAEGKDVEIDYSMIRPAGARLMTMGGRASGPQPLIDLMKFTRGKMFNAQGRQLTALELHDIICQIGLIVVAGGVRRSALISLSELHDKELRDAKSGEFWNENGQRSMANNSAVYAEKPSVEEFGEEWAALVASGTGERGIFNRGSLENQVPARRWEKLKNQNQVGVNPCFPASEYLLTSSGYRTFGDLYKEANDNIILTDNRITYVDNGAERPENWKFDYSKSNVAERTASPVLLTQKNVDIVNVSTREGFSVRCTPDHHIATMRGMVEAKDLTSSDEILISLPEQTNVISAPNTINEKSALLIGLIAGDGTFDKKHSKVMIDLWGEDAERMASICTNIIQELYDTEYEYGHTTVGGAWENRKMSPCNVQRRFDKVRIQSSWLFNYLKNKYGFSFDTKLKVPTIIYNEVFTSGRQYLAGLFYADSSVQGTDRGGYSIRLAQSDKQLLMEVQVLLQANGIYSSIHSRRPAMMRMLPDGMGGVKEYSTKENFELIISMGRDIFGKSIGFSGHPDKESKLANIRTPRKDQPNTAHVVSVVADGNEDVYCLKQDETRTLIVNGIAARRCGEIYLRSKQFCNLTSIVVRPDDDMESLKRKMRLATLLGTYQATLTDFGYLGEDWKKNCEEEQLLGVSITGYFDNELVRNDDTLDELREESIKANEEYSSRFGSNRSTAITCVKPHGNSGQLLYVGSGMHPWFAKHYIRRVRISVNDPLMKMVQDQGIPVLPEVGYSTSTASTMVMEFPIKAPEGALTNKDVTALDMLKEWKRLKKHFTEHNPSVTIYAGNDEWDDIKDFVYNNWDDVGGLSFLPRSEHVYQLAPYEEITEEEYNERKAAFKDIDFSRLSEYEKTDETVGAKELACAGPDGCEVK